MFVSRQARLVQAPRILKEKHLKLRVVPETNEGRWQKAHEVVAWRMAERSAQEALALGDVLDLAFTLDYNDHPDFGGLQLTLVDFARSEQSRRSAALHPAMGSAGLQARVGTRVCRCRWNNRLSEPPGATNITAQHGARRGGRSAGCEWEKVLESRSDGTVLTHTLQARVRNGLLIGRDLRRARRYWVDPTFRSASKCHNGRSDLILNCHSERSEEPAFCSP